jgi:hypothetical protein
MKISILIQNRDNLGRMSPEVVRGAADHQRWSLSVRLYEGRSDGLSAPRIYKNNHASSIYWRKKRDQRLQKLEQKEPISPLRNITREPANCLPPKTSFHHART